MRTFLYWLSRTLGDFSALQKNRVIPRIKRRVVGKLIGKYLMRRIK